MGTTAIANVLSDLVVDYFCFFFLQPICIARSQRLYNNHAHAKLCMRREENKMLENDLCNHLALQWSHSYRLYWKEVFKTHTNSNYKFIAVYTIWPVPFASPDQRIRTIIFLWGKPGKVPKDDPLVLELVHNFQCHFHSYSKKKNQASKPNGRNRRRSRQKGTSLMLRFY